MSGRETSSGLFVGRSQALIDGTDGDRVAVRNLDQLIEEVERLVAAQGVRGQPLNVAAVSDGRENSGGNLSVGIEH